MYAKEFQQSLKAVEAARAANIAYEPARMTAKEKDDLLAAYHPDYKKSEFKELSIGPNKGEAVPHELCDMLQAHSRISAADVDLDDVRYDVDVLIIGGGGSMNKTLVQAVARALPECRVLTNEDLGYDSNAKEAVAFAVLANETIFAGCNNVPTVTGAKNPVVMGKISL